MKLTFWGAAQQVTGSMFLLQTDAGFKILIDCGLSYEKHQSLDENLAFEFEPSSVNTVILTHAHIDHSGNLPTLIKQGFNGNIICTEPTAALVRGLLDDSASIQALKQKRSKGKSGRLYGFKEVKDTLDQVLTLPFYKSFELNNEVNITLYEAGHILGAASVLVDVKEKSGHKRIGFTGDLGPVKSAIIVPPKPMPSLDYLVSESTYGNRMHKDTVSAEDLLLKHIKETCVDQPGRLIIPAFSIGRTQSILFTLNKLFRSNRLPNVRIINDSPLAIEGSRIHEAFISNLNEDAREFYAQNGSLLEFKNLYTIEDEEDEELLGNHVHASVIVSSAGMMEGGRIQQHISNNLQNPFCRILVAGFCAPGTLGHDLLHHKGTLRIKNNVKNVYAVVKSTDVFSAHPDSKGLIEYVESTAQESNLKRVFLVHGDEESLRDFKSTLDNLDICNITIPKRGQSFEL